MADASSTLKLSLARDEARLGKCGFRGEVSELWKVNRIISGSEPSAAFNRHHKSVRREWTFFALNLDELLLRCGISSSFLPSIFLLPGSFLNDMPVTPGTHPYSPDCCRWGRLQVQCHGPGTFVQLLRLSVAILWSYHSNMEFLESPLVQPQVTVSELETSAADSLPALGVTTAATTQE